MDREGQIITGTAANHPDVPTAERHCWGPGKLTGPFDRAVEQRDLQKVANVLPMYDAESISRAWPPSTERVITIPGLTTYFRLDGRV